LAPDGKRDTYDISGTTNYSGVLAQQNGIEGMRTVARNIRVLVPEVRGLGPWGRRRAQN